MPKRPQQKIVGQRLSALMEDRGIKNLPLANAIGVAASQIKRWRDNQTAAMPDAVRALAAFFNVSEAFLYGVDATDVRERLASEIARALGTPEAEIVRAFGALEPNRRQLVAGKVLGWIEAETTMPLPERKSPSSMIRRNALGATRAKDGEQRHAAQPHTTPEKR